MVSVFVRIIIIYIILNAYHVLKIVMIASLKVNAQDVQKLIKLSLMMDIVNVEMDIMKNKDFVRVLIDSNQFVTYYAKLVMFQVNYAYSVFLSNLEY